jgi:hypothetical protein
MDARRSPLPLPARLAGVAVAAVAALALSACGDTVQQRPVPHSQLEELIVAPYPVYWLGASFRRLALSETIHDPSGSYSVQYGACVVGGQGVCVPHLRVITSPDNSFLPGGATHQSTAVIRGVPARLAQHGRTIVLATGPVVVELTATDAALARAAAQTMVAINEPSSPGSRLAAPAPDTGFGSTPLPSQMPSPLRRLR